METITTIDLPCSRREVEKLRVGQAVDLRGTIYTGRDRLHQFVGEGGKLPVDLAGGAIYHCGPIITTGDDNQWRVVAAGPTTSMRQEPFMARMIQRLGIRIIIGKGGMGPDTVEACRRYGCVYLQAAGGAAAWFARRINAISGAWFADRFGPAEAMWGMEVGNFRCSVGIDTKGGNLYSDVAHSSRARLARLLAAGKKTKPARQSLKRSGRPCHD